jgi:hypothetical protein
MTTSNGNGAGGDRPSGERRSRGLPLQAASRVTGLVTSVMDLHVRIALQEADRDTRRRKARRSSTSETTGSA